MINARKQALENTMRQRLVAIREKELDYYTANCRNIGNSASLVAGLAYSGIRYHYLLERQHNYHLSTGDSLEECVFLSLLSITIGCALQTVFVAMLAALFGPNLALRGPEGSLHDAVEGMHQWNSVILALFFTSLLLLQLSAFSFMYGHSQLTLPCRVLLLSTISLSLFAFVYYSRLIMVRLRVPKEHRVTGAFVIDGEWHSETFDDGAPTNSDGQRTALLSSRPPAKLAGDATRIHEDVEAPLTAEALDAAVASFNRAPRGFDASACDPSHAEGADAAAGCGGGGHAEMRAHIGGGDGVAALVGEADAESDAEEDAPLVERGGFDSARRGARRLRRPWTRAREPLGREGRPESWDADGGAWRRPGGPAGSETDFLRYLIGGLGSARPRRGWFGG